MALPFTEEERVGKPPFIREQNCDITGKTQNFSGPL
jgi:hypothetical protein